jgi:hypothetical protein
VISLRVGGNFQLAAVCGFQGEIFLCFFFEHKPVLRLLLEKETLEKHEKTLEWKGKDMQQCSMTSIITKGGGHNIRLVLLMGLLGFAVVDGFALPVFSQKALPLRTHVQRPSKNVTPCMQSQDEKKNIDKVTAGKKKWEVTVEDESAERIESVKAGVLSAVSGSVAMTPVALLVPETSNLYSTD